MTLPTCVKVMVGALASESASVNVARIVTVSVSRTVRGTGVRKGSPLRL